MLRKTDLAKFDMWFIVLVILLVFVGIVSIYSAGFDQVTNTNNGMYKKQFLWFVLGLLLLIGITLVNFRFLETYCFYIYVAILFVLVLTTFLAPAVRNTRAWISVGFFSFQPSEFMKLATVIMLAKYLELRERDIHNFRELFLPAVIVIVPVVIILLQPDFGTALVFLPVLFTMLFIAGADVTHLVSISSIALISLFVPMYVTFHEVSHVEGGNLIVSFFKHNSLPFIVSSILLLVSLVFFGLRYMLAKKGYRRIYLPGFAISIGMFFAVLIQHSLKDYQKNRILVYLNPDLDPRGAGYNVIQAKIAIGSGGFFGKGYLSGTQTQLGFLPEKTSDFIFPVIAEEWGFFGVLITLLLIFGIVYQGFKIALESKDKFSQLLAAGISSIFFFHAVINIGMVIGLTPVTGIPLSFVSYGGSNLMMSLLAAGILLSIKMHRSA